MLLGIMNSDLALQSAVTQSHSLIPAAPPRALPQSICYLGFMHSAKLAAALRKSHPPTPKCISSLKGRLLRHKEVRTLTVVRVGVKSKFGV